MFTGAGYYAERLRFIKREAPFFDLDGMDLDDVIPFDRIPSREKLATNQQRVSRGLLLRDLIAEVEGITMRQFLQRIRGSGHLDVVGTADQVAEVFAE